MGSSLTIRNGNIVYSDGVRQGCISVSDGYITDDSLPSRKGTEIDADGCYVLPGLIDLHTHGIAFETWSSESLLEYSRLEASFGCTTFILTMFGPPEESAEHLRKHRKNTDELRAVPQIGGFRLESPYLADSGGGASRDLAAISEKATNELLEAGGSHIRIWDISPELQGSLELISRLSRNSIICSVAHTRATVEHTRRAVDAGVRLVTHLFDMFEVPETTDPGVYPAGLVDYLLVEDRVACEIIADGTHVHPLLVEKALRCKPDGMVIVITDSNLGAGLPPGTYQLAGGWGKARVDGPNNGVRLVDRDRVLAGSALTPLNALQNCIRIFGKDLVTASRLCSLNPARLLGLNKGEIAVGKDADLIILDDKLELLYTIYGGKTIYSRK